MVLYDKCSGYRCVDSYFSRSFVKAVINEVNLGHGEREAANQIILDYLSTDSEGKSKPLNILTDLGNFLHKNYASTNTSADLEHLFATQSPATDWVFYLAIPPAKYERMCGMITDHFRLAEANIDLPESAQTRKIVLLEKPFQVGADKADKLAALLEGSETQVRGLSFYAVDHYAAKWTLSEIPDLVTNLAVFRQFVNQADEIIIELLERQDIPDFRLGYMATTGLFADMMPHALVPLQFLFGGKEVHVNVKNSRLLVCGSYKGYQQQLTNWINNNPASKYDVKNETYFSLELEIWVSVTQGLRPMLYPVGREVRSSRPEGFSHIP